MKESDSIQVNNGSKARGRRAAAVILMAAALLFSVWFMQKFMCIPFSYDEIRIINFHKEPENSIDVLLLGSSETYSDFASVYAYKYFGFTSYPYAIGGSTCTMWKPALKDALCTQKPKLVIVDVFGGGYDPELIDSRNNQLSIVMSHTAWSREKIATAMELSGIVDRSSAASFLFPFIKYHNNVPATVPDLPERLLLEASGPSPLKGENTMNRRRKCRDVDPASFTDDTAPLDPKTEEIILDFIDFCRSEDIEVLFVKFPSVITFEDPEEMEVNLRSNRILQIAEENGCHALNMQKYFHVIGLKERKDFYNHGHTNLRGQRKITFFLGQYLQLIGFAPSEYDDSVKAEWDEAVKYWDVFEKVCDIEIQKNAAVNIGDEPSVVNELSRMIE